MQPSPPPHFQQQTTWRRPPPPRQGLEWELESFRGQYPMDDRAFQYLLDSPPEVCAEVLEKFAPKQERGDSDFSAPIISFTKRCRQGGSAQPVAPAYFHASPPVPSRAPWAGAGGPGGGCFRGSNVSDGLGSSRSPWVEQEEMNSFCQKYPIDERAAEYLNREPPEVIAKVVRNFRPKREGDDDYSGAVVTFVGMCSGKRARLA